MSRKKNILPVHCLGGVSGKMMLMPTWQPGPGLTHSSSCCVFHGAYDKSTAISYAKNGPSPLMFLRYVQTDSRELADITILYNSSICGSMALKMFSIRASLSCPGVPLYAQTIWASVYMGRPDSAILRHRSNATD